jgi:PKD repeat protein
LYGIYIDTWTWDIPAEGVCYNAQTINHAFTKTGEQQIKVTVTAGGYRKELVKTIYIQPRPIVVTYPDGYQKFSIAASTPSSPLITNYGSLENFVGRYQYP